MNTSPPEGLFTPFLRRSIDAMQSECRTAYDALSRVLGDRRVGLHVSGERVCVRVHAGAIVVDADHGDVRDDVVVWASHHAIVDLIDGRTRLGAAIDVEAIDLAGSTDEIAFFHDALRLYVHGAVRSRSQGALLGAYRREIESAPHEAGGVR